MKNMKKLNKKQLSEKLESLRFVINDSHGAVLANEILNGIVNINIRANDLILALECPLNGHAKKIALDCESQIDRATKYVLAMEKRYKEMK